MTARKKPNLNLRRFIPGLPNIFLNAFVRFRVETAKFRCLISLRALLLVSVFEIIVTDTQKHSKRSLFDIITILNYETVIITHNLIQYLSANFHKAVNITTFVSMYTYTQREIYEVGPFTPVWVQYLADAFLELVSSVSSSFRFNMRIIAVNLLAVTLFGLSSRQTDKDGWVLVSCCPSSKFFVWVMCRVWKVKLN